MSKSHEINTIDLLEPAPRSEKVDAWDMDVHVGSVLGKYRLLAELGQGGMSNVYLAVARGPSGFNKLVVLKMLRPSLARDPHFLSMFLDEARLSARLNHPNVVQTNEVGIEDARHLIAMEYLEGQPLSRILQRAQASGTPMSTAMHLRILVETMVGLHYAHELSDFDGSPMNLVHRDVSPQNIFVTYDGQVKILDFGIAKAVTSSVNTTAGVVKGKIAYMSPEQFAGEPIDRRADLFALGVLLWECATGTRMWKKKSDAVVLQAVMGGNIPSPRTVNPTVDERFVAICRRALSVKPSDRYASALDLEHDVEQILASQPERVVVRDIGKYVSDLFKEDRSAVRAIVEKQLMAAKRLPTGEYAALGYAPTLASGQNTAPPPLYAGAMEGTPSQMLPPPFPGAYAPDGGQLNALVHHPMRLSGSHVGVASTIRPPGGAGAWRWVVGLTLGAAAFAFAGFYWAKSLPASASSATNATSVTAAAADAPTVHGVVINTPEPAEAPTIAAQPAIAVSSVAAPSSSSLAPTLDPASAATLPASAFAPRRTAPLASASAPRPLPMPAASAAPAAVESVAPAEPPHRGRKIRTDI